MADDKTIAEALDLLGQHVIFREETQERDFAELVAEIRGEPEEEPALEDLTKPALLARAEALGVAVTPGDTKAEIIAALEEAEA